jgi:putative FmdB family regulatory protein
MPRTLAIARLYDSEDLRRQGAPRLDGVALASFGRRGRCMPSYEFQCSECHETFDLVTSISEYEKMKEEHSVTCTACGSTNVERHITEFQVQTSRKSA